MSGKDEQPGADDDVEELDDAISLEELSQSYAQLTGQPASLPLQPADAFPELETVGESGELASAEVTDESGCPVTPLSIIEAVLMLGRPDNAPITSAELASLMRGVQQSEVEHWIAELNQRFEHHRSAFRVVEAGIGYRMQLSDDLKFIADRFYGSARPVHLNQSAIDCLALVAYQPGISRDEIEKQRGQASGAVLNQLVRRQLLEIQREEQGKALKALYYPSERLLQLAGLASLDDLPQVEEAQP